MRTIRVSYEMPSHLSRPTDKMAKAVPTGCKRSPQFHHQTRWNAPSPFVHASQIVTKGNMKANSLKLTRIVSALTLWSLFAAFLPVPAMGGNEINDPKSFSRWTVVGPDGGDVRAIAIDPRDKDRLYISTLDGQIHTSGDAGRTWRLLVNLEKPQLVIDDILVDLKDSRLIYASGHRHKQPGGFFKSSDGGRTWKESIELKNEAIHAMAQSESDPNQLFVGTTNGVWRSMNKGESWSKIASGTMPINVNSLAVDPRGADTIYAGTWWRAYKSTDSGKSWRLIKDGMIDDSDVFAITINERNRDHLVASACSGIYESMNGGEKWRKIQGIPSTSRRTRDIFQHPTQQGTIYAATTEGFWMSVNGGASWSMTTPRSLEINAVAVHPAAPERVFIATNVNGVMVSNDGGRSFRQTNGSFTSRLVYSVVADIAMEGRVYATVHNTATSGGFLFYSNDGGQNWAAARGLEASNIASFAIMQDRAEPNRMYLGTSRGIFRSLDRGASWSFVGAAKAPARAPARKMTAAQRRAAAAAAAKQAAAKIVPSLNERVKALAPTADGRNGMFAATDSGLYRTYDIAKGWEKFAFGTGVSSNVFAVYSSPQDSDTIWAGTATSGVVVSHDGGKTWEMVGKKGGPPINIPVISVAGDPKRPEIVYAGTTQTLYITRDGGKTWARAKGNLPLGKFTSIIINPENTDEVFVSSSLETDGGIYFSDDAGREWRRVDSKEMGVPSRRVWSLSFAPGNPKRIFAASHSSGVYRIDRLGDTGTGGKKISVATNDK